MYVIKNLMHLASQINRSLHLNDLLLDIDYSYTSCKCILDDMMSIRSKPRNVGHDLCHDLKEILWVPNFYYICQICYLRLGLRGSGFAHD